jgi:hypothetical protein
MIMPNNWILNIDLNHYIKCFLNYKNKKYLMFILILIIFS